MSFILTIEKGMRSSAETQVGERKGSLGAGVKI